MKVEARKDYISWDEYFMGIAALSALRSKDPSTRNGSVIVDPETKHIISTGYNGMVNGNDVDYTWSREPLKDGIGSKYNYILHAEENSILNATRSVKGATIFIYSEKAYFPCDHCMRMILQSQIKEIVLADIIDANTDKYDWKPTLHMAKVSGIKIRNIGKVASNASFLKIAEEFKAMAGMLG